ncbi:MAG: hypothetical protein ACLFUE_02965 [Desulfobacteraceae bacterium]
MRRFPFKILFLCLLIPPVGYVSSLDLLESYLGRREAYTIERVVIQDQQALLEGRHSVEAEIRRNISRHLAGSLVYDLGVRTRILVKSGERILYPVDIREQMRGEAGEDRDFDYMETASENFKVLNEGLDVQTDLEIRHKGWLANGVLLFWVLLSAGILHTVLRRRARVEDEEQEREMEALAGQLEQAKSTLEAVREREEEYRQRIGELSRERDKLTQDVDGLLEELEGLEQGAARQKDLREETELEVMELREELDRAKEKLKKPKKKEVDSLKKRLSSLYKNLEFTDRSMEGMAELPGDAQLKAEELIKALDQDQGRVAVKRKVFGKGGKTNVLEAEFAYSGRLYFQKIDGRTWVLAIGTKNTQAKDLAYLESFRAGKAGGG